MNNIESKRRVEISASVNAERSESLARARELAAEFTEEGIGTLGEKMLHKVLKFYVEPNPECHEISVLGSVADVFDGERITEIQTRSFEKLRPKLAKFLPEYPVTLICPLVARRFVNYIDKETGEASERRKSPKSDTLNRAACELYKIADFLKSPNLTVKVILLEFEDFRYKAPKKAWQKSSDGLIERVPTAVLSEFLFTAPEDYGAFLPSELGVRFTAKELQKLIKLDQRRTHNTLKLLLSLGIIDIADKNKNAFIYEIKG